MDGYSEKKIKQILIICEHWNSDKKLLKNYIWTQQQIFEWNDWTCHRIIYHIVPTIHRLNNFFCWWFWLNCEWIKKNEWMNERWCYFFDFPGNCRFVVSPIDNYDYYSIFICIIMFFSIRFTHVLLHIIDNDVPFFSSSFPYQCSLFGFFFCFCSRLHSNQTL